MNDRRTHVETIFLAALEKETFEEQSAYLDQACAGDDELRARVIALLGANDQAGSFLDKPSVELASTTAHDASSERSESQPRDIPLDFLDPCETPDRLGTLGHYEIVEVAGQGGMGIVLKGIDTKLNRVVAIKVLGPHLAGVEQLEELNLCGTHVTEKGIRYLRGLTALKRLTLNHLLISDTVLAQLSGLSQLTHLSLMHTEITDAGLASLAKLKSLRQVCLVGTSVTQEAVERLQQSLPQCNISYAAGAPVDLLSRIDTNRESLLGRWTSQNGTIVSPKWKRGKRKFKCLQVPYSPAGDYVLEALVRRESGNDTVMFGIVVDGHRTGVCFDTYPNVGCVTGFSFLDKMDVVGNETGVVGRVLNTNDQPTRVVITVRAASVTVACNDKVLVDWRGALNRLSLLPAYARAEKDQLFLGAYSDAFRISQVKLTPISTTGDEVGDSDTP